MNDTYVYSRNLSESSEHFFHMLGSARLNMIVSGRVCEAILHVAKQISKVKFAIKVVSFVKTYLS